MMFNTMAYERQLMALLPYGPAWPRDPDTILAGIMGGVAAEFARVDGRAADLLDESDPRSSLELLPDWERLVGLPDACVPVTGAIRERQLAVAAKVAGLGGQSRSYYIGLAASLGFTITIDEFAAGTVNSTCDQTCADDGWAVVWRVNVTDDNDQGDYSSAWANADSGCDEAIRNFGSGQLECLINRAKPAHTIVLFAYPDQPDPLLWYNFINPS